MGRHALMKGLCRRGALYSEGWPSPSLLPLCGCAQHLVPTHFFVHTHTHTTTRQSLLLLHQQRAQGALRACVSIYSCLLWGTLGSMSPISDMI